jgi:hypothetical protein
MTHLKRSALAAFAALILLTDALPAAAHHSAAMYDRAHPRTLEGVVKDFQWTNPHVWIQVVVPDSRGGSEMWGVECTSVNFMTRRGWSKETLKPGDKVVLSVSPLKDGSNGGGFLNLTSLNGQPFKASPEE